MSKITREELLELLDIDVEKGMCFWKDTCSRHKMGDQAGGKVRPSKKHKSEYLQITIKRQHLYIHQIIWFIAKGYWAKGIDHKDRNGLNNCISNLREASHSENNYNVAIRKDNKSGHKGVSWDKVNNSWFVEIGVAGKAIKLGRYKNLEQAIYVRQCAERKYHGEFRYE